MTHETKEMNALTEPQDLVGETIGITSARTQGVWHLVPDGQPSGRGMDSTSLPVALCGTELYWTYEYSADRLIVEVGTLCKRCAAKAAQR